MKNKAKNILGLILVILVLVLSQEFSSDQDYQGQWKQAQVLEVIDGDTIQVSLDGQKRRVRLIGIDAPESVHPKTGVEPLGPEASQFTKKHLEGRKVYLEYDQESQDDYGRDLAYVWLKSFEESPPSKEDFAHFCYNAYIVKKGYALETAYGDNTRHQVFLASFEKEAIQGYQGLWQEGGPGRDTSQGKIKGNRKSRIYHLPGSLSYDKLSPKNTVYFPNQAQAELAGYRRSMSK